MVFGFYRGKQAVGAAKSLVPTFLVKVNILRVDLVEEARVSDMQFIRCYSYDGTWHGRLSQANPRNRGEDGVSDYFGGQVPTYRIRREASQFACSTGL